MFTVKHTNTTFISTKNEEINTGLKRNPEFSSRENIYDTNRRGQLCETYPPIPCVRYNSYFSKSLGVLPTQSSKTLRKRIPSGIISSIEVHSPLVEEKCCGTLLHESVFHAAIVFKQHVNHNWPHQECNYQRIHSTFQKEYFPKDISDMELLTRQVVLLQISTIK